MLASLPGEILDLVLQFVLELEAYGPDTVCAGSRACWLPPFVTSLKSMCETSPRWVSAVERAYAALALPIPATAAGSERYVARAFPKLRPARLWAQVPTATGLFSLGLYAGGNALEIKVQQTLDSEPEVFRVVNDYFLAQVQWEWSAEHRPFLFSDSTGDRVAVLLHHADKWLLQRDGSSYVATILIGGLPPSELKSCAAITEEATVLTHAGELFVVPHDGRPRTKLCGSDATHLAVCETPNGLLVAVVCGANIMLFTVTSTTKQKAIELPSNGVRSIITGIKVTSTQLTVFYDTGKRIIQLLGGSPLGLLSNMIRYCQVIHTSTTSRWHFLSLSTQVQYRGFTFAILQSAHYNRVDISTGVCLNSNGRTLYCFALPPLTQRLVPSESGLLCGTGLRMGGSYLTYELLLPWLPKKA